MKAMSTPVLDCQLDAIGDEAVVGFEVDCAGGEPTDMLTTTTLASFSSADMGSTSEDAANHSECPTCRGRNTVETAFSGWKLKARFGHISRCMHFGLFAM
ncbi:hypothetical protein Y032_0096g2903 [Ancylostoma ceylanicum]|uniref:Uncharacterized protein n=1 Tax=Ancylostoma ceylanicum TaxID=53326 RepID=A0A016TK16_9BILA|nr:hypothetical protein Y032_0096g2903 [Ancylostoma ceylanicum]